jgi:hypothetical protein
MSKKTILISFLALAVLFLVASSVCAQETILKTEKVKPGDLRGFLKDSRGKPFTKVELTLMDENGQLVQKAITNANGEYRFTNLAEGTYTLNVAGRPAFKLEVTPTAGVDAIQARLPSTVRDPDTGLLVPQPLSTLEWTVIIVGGVAVAIAVPTIIHHNEDSDSRKKKVSP